MKKISTEQIGDFKTPNKYWVTVGNSYDYAEDHCLNWIDELIKDFKRRGKTLKIFDSYREAKDFTDNLYLGQKEDDFTINVIQIEDRLTGELYCKTKVYYPETGKISEDEQEDYHFTENELAKRNIKFE